MREEFEKLPEIASKLDHVYFEDGYYYPKYDDTHEDAMYVDGAWYAYQEQQKKINSMLDHVCGTHKEFQK